MATEKLRAELEILTAKAEKDLKRFDRSLAGVERRITSMGGKGGKSLKPLGEGLSAATVNANEFEKSMAAANARVIAFGASAGLILQVQRALKETVRATIEVEKSLTDINVVLNTNTKGLQKFGDSLFKIAGQTGQGFKTVAVAATELARQGLGMEQTLKRTSDALILTRLTGMQAEEAVSSLTAAVNSFSKAGITSSQVVNKMAKVDQAFAVSSDDLAKAISRVGSSAVDAGVSMDELLAITTAVQQRTARGGAVIGNAFKTIFTRIGRTDVQKKLAGIGVATRDMTTGAMLPATKVLENLSVKFQELSKSQQNQIAESVAGVFQVNILRAALGDLSSKYGVYNRALKESATATNEAYLKNEQLNQTLDALVNKTLANLTKAGAAIGGATLKPAIENVLGLVNSAIGAFGEGGRFEEFGKGIGKDIMTGIGNFIAGPGLVIATAGIIKLGASFVGFAKDALKGFADIGRQAATRRNVEAQITSELTRQPEILKRIQAGELSAAAAAKDMLAAMKATNLQADRLAITSRAIAANMFGLAGGTRGLRGSGAGRAQGFIPNFADPNAERASAAMGGYKAGAIKTMNIPGQGSVMYNSAETVKRFPGMQQPAIMPPQGSRAGSNYQKAFGAAHGFDPYAAGGFVPNFNKMSIKQFLGLDKSAKIKDIRVNEERSKQIEEAAAAGKLRFDDYSDNAALAAAVTRGKLRAQGNKTEQVGKNYTHNAGYLGLLGLEGSHLGTSTTSLGKIARFVDAGIDPRLLNRKVTFTNMQSKSIDEITKGSTRVNKSRFSDLISEKMTTPVSEIANEIFRKGLGDDHKIAVADLQKQFKGSHQLLPPGAEGSIFEAAVNLGLLTTKKSPKARLDAFDQSTKGAQKPFDFEESGRAKPPFKDIFHFEDPLLYADAKRTIDNKSMGTLIKKAYNQGLPGLPGLELLEGGATVAKGAKKVKALGHVPNFSPLGDAITRERAAGVPRSAIRVGASASLKSAGNPAGLGVYNTIDEPAGLHQGISRSRSMGINPKGHGVPNYARMPAAGIMRPKPASPVDKAKDRRSTEKFDRSTDKLESAAEELTEAAGGMGKSMAILGGLTTAGYIAAPMLERAGAGEEGMGRFQSLMGTAAIMSMLPRAPKTGPGMMGGFRSGFGSKFSGTGAFGRGATRSFGTRLMDGLSQGAKSFGKGLVGMGDDGKFKPMRAGKALLSKIALPATAVLGAYDFATGAISGFKETPEEKALREAQEAAAKMRENKVPQVAEQVMAKASVFAGGFKTSTGRVKAQQVRSIRDDLFGAGGMTEAGADSKELAKIYQDFANSFSGSAAEVEAAKDKFNDSIEEIKKTVQDNKKAIEAGVKAASLRAQIASGTFDPEMVPTALGRRKRRLSAMSGVMHHPKGHFEEVADVAKRVKAGEPTERKKFNKKQTNLLAEVILADVKGGAQGVRERILDGLKGIEDKGLRKEGAAALLEGLDDITSFELGIDPKMIRQLNRIDPILLKSALKKLKDTLNISADEMMVAGIEPKFDQGRQRRKGIELQSGAAAARFGIDEERMFFKNLQADFAQDDKTAALRRSYQDALKASTMGLHGESEIRLRETKQSLQEAYQRNTVEAQAELGLLDRELAADLQTARGSILQRFVNPEMQDDVLSKVDEVSGLRGGQASARLASIVAELQDPETKPDDKLFLQEQQKVLQVIVKQNAARRDNTNILDRANAELEHGITQAELQLEIDKQILENKYKYNRVLDMETRQKEVQLQEDKNRYLRTDFMSGRITGEDFAAANARTRSMRRDAFGMAGEPMAGFGELMGDSYRYGTRNAAEDFERGMVDVAQNIRSGFKDSIKAVVTDSESFSDALVGVMDGLLDRTFETGLDVLTGKLFNAIGNIATRSKGGPIPRGYNQGGVVTGGSGVRDDVMTFMQGGEYVIKKSSAQRIGYSTLNAINSYASGGKARVSLAKDFLYTGDDPTRPTGGGYAVSKGLSTAALFRDDDPQTGRVFGRQSTLANYLEYRRGEEARRKAEVDRVKQMKRGRLMKAYASAAMNIGAGYLIGRSQGLYGGSPESVQGPGGAVMHKQIGEGGSVSYGPTQQSPFHPNRTFGGARGGSPALVQGGEYIMSPQTTAKYGTGFMAELNRGRMPGFNMGGAVGGGGGGLAAGGITTNNVNLAINIDKGGKSSVQSESSSGSGQDKEREDKSEVERQKKMGEAIRGVVLKEIERQQRPGGLLRDNASYAGGRKT